MTKRINPSIRPTPRELRWFAHIDRHGPQSSAFLIELTKDTHRCGDTALRRLQALREAGYLFLPPQQRHIAKADFSPYVYDLTKAGFEYLSYQQPLERHARPTGHWWHGFWVSSMTSAIEISARRNGCEFIPPASILGIRNVPLGIPLSQATLVPDQVFAIKHADGFRSYALEVDRGTEPICSSSARKSLKSMAEHYQELLALRTHQDHFGIRSNMWLLAVFASHARKKTFKNFAAKCHRTALTGSWSAPIPNWEELAQLSYRLIDFRKQNGWPDLQPRPPSS